MTLIGGLAFFLYGISIMSSGLEKIAGGKLEKLLKKMTSSPLKGLLLGAGITAVIQPGGSINDKLSVEYCNEHGIAMVKTSVRHFKH